MSSVTDVRGVRGKEERYGGISCGAGISSVDQVAVVVRDLDASMKRYVEEFGIEPWSVYTFSPDWIQGMTFHGKEQGYSMKLALADVGGMMY